MSRSTLFLLMLAAPLATLAGEAANGAPAPEHPKEGRQADADLEREVAALVGRLGDKDFKTREEATARLTELGQKDKEALLALLPKEHADPEVADRCAKIREILTEGPPLSPEAQNNELHAIKCARACLEAAAVYRKLAVRDADGDGTGEWPTADGDTWANVVDGGGHPLVLMTASRGERKGYRFKMTADPKDPEKACFITAIPIEPGKTGRRTFCINSDDCAIYESPTGAKPPDTWDTSKKGPGGDFRPVEE